MTLSLACGRLESVVLSFCIIARRSERGMGSQFGRALACCKVDLERPLIPTAVVANLFRSARVFRWGAVGRGLGDRRSQRTGRVRRPLPEPACTRLTFHRYWTGVW